MPLSHDAQQILRAADYAAQLHTGQRRKGAAAEPYVNHLLEVAKLVSDAGAETDVVIAALLHDGVEDTALTGHELAAAWGEQVAGLVVECTDDKDLPKAERKQQQVENAPHKSPGAAMIKIADKTSNLRAVLSSPPVDWSEQRQREYFDWAEQVVHALPSPNPQLLAGFEQVVEQFRQQKAG